jgi:hypothetical protein
MLERLAFCSRAEQSKQSWDLLGCFLSSWHLLHRAMLPAASKVRPFRPLKKKSKSSLSLMHTKRNIWFYWVPGSLAWSLCQAKSTGMEHVCGQENQEKSERPFGSEDLFVVPLPPIDPSSCWPRWQSFTVLFLVQDLRGFLKASHPFSVEVPIKLSLILCSVPPDCSSTFKT